MYGQYSPPSSRPDPVAAAIGNASLLGVGYWLLRQRLLAGLTLVVSAVLVAVLASGQVWPEFLLLAWWAGMVLHGWWLARRSPARAAAPGQRLVAVAVAVPVLLVVTLLRVRADHIGQAVAEARRAGDCAAAVHALHGVWFGPRLANAPLAARDERTADACRRVQAAQDTLARGLRTGDPHALQDGFDGLERVSARFPGHEAVVATAITAFSKGLPTSDPCRTATITDWLGKHRASSPNRTRIERIVARTAPAALIGCADRHTATRDWTRALARYRQLVAQYPHARLVARAEAGIKRATLAQQLERVTRLLDTTTGTLPEYCSHPAPYSVAPAYRAGLNPARFYAADVDSDSPYDGAYIAHIPRAWRSRSIATTTLIVCAGAEKDGTAVQTCPYENKLLHAFPIDVTFHKIAIPVRAYELRTGRQVVHTTVQVGGTSCPDPLPYTVFSAASDIGPPGDVYVNASAGDVKAAFRPVFVR